jgi:cell wall-associated NlpC family hydrolase
MKKMFFVINVILLLLSCKNENDLKIIESPTQIAFNALEYAKEYVNADTQYEWGGRDPLRSIKIDCSGLILRCYEHAVSNTEYSLPFKNATVSTLFNNWSIATDNPRAGDLIFMGDDKNDPSHISLFVRNDGINIYFIDSTLKPEDNINGVSERFYMIDDYRFLSFGKLLITCK